jgi:outer membrane protein OmpA-like peptidoglycan-associated protein
MKISTNQNLKRGSVITGVVLSSLLVASCAMTPAAPQGSMDARSKLTALKNDPDLADRARVEIRKAEEAVVTAEKPLPESEAALGEHRVYMADRTVAIAEARAATRYAEDQRARLGEERDAARLEARTRETEKARAEAARARSEADAAQKSKSDAAAVADQQAAEYQRQIDALQAEITDRGVVLTLGDVLFATGSADLQGGASSNLNKLVVFLNDYPARRVQIEGHTDNVGSAAYNQGLSQRRADSVRYYLTQKGIDSQRLSASGIGMDRPVSKNDSQAGRQQNRRVEIIIENPAQS